MLCAVLVAVPLAGLRAARLSPEAADTTVQAAAVAPSRAPVVEPERVVRDRASRSDGWARRAIEELPIEEFASTTTAAPITTAAPRRVTATTRAPSPTTTAARRSAPTTTAAPRPTTTAAPRPAPTRDASPPTTSEPNAQSGKASWYEAAPPGTCAHRTLAMGTIVTVTHTGNGKQVRCKVADRGPYVNGWIIDLSKDTFSALAPLDAGVIPVRLTW